MTISDYSGLFGLYGNDMAGGLFNQSGTQNGAFGTAVLYKGFSEVNSIGYKRLLKNYFAQAEGEAESQAESVKGREPLSKKLESLKQEEVRKANAGAAKELKAGAESVLSAARVLIEVDDSQNNVLFSKDADTIRSAVKTFVKEYNGLLSDVEGSGYQNNRMESLKNQLVSLSKANQYQLEKVGITVGRDGTMTIKEDIFAASDLDKLKEIFGNSGSFAGRAADKADYISQKAEHYTNDSYGTYTSTKSYNSILGTGNLFNNFF